jgi:hypothetical protein
LRLIVGGAPYRFDNELYKAVGADAWAPDGVNAGKVIVELIREMKKSNLANAAIQVNEVNEDNKP